MATLIGTNGNDELRGGMENDEIFGLKGDDIMAGNGGADILYPGLGGDKMSGGMGIDTVNYADANTVIHLDLAALYNKTASAGSAVGSASYGDSLEDYFHNLIGGSASDYLRGNQLNNVIEGNNGADTIISRSGDDEVYGDNGADKIYGGDGNDYLVGDAGDDLVEGGNGDDFIFGEEGADVLRGQNGSDGIYGGDGDDMITGGAGGDYLVGGDGSDSLSGGADGDTFGYLSLSDSDSTLPEAKSVSYGYDSITDFQVGVDFVDLSAISELALENVAILDNGASNYTLYVTETDFAVNVKTTGGVFTLTDVSV